MLLQTGLFLSSSSWYLWSKLSLALFPASTEHFSTFSSPTGTQETSIDTLLPLWFSFMTLYYLLNGLLLMATYVPLCPAAEAPIPRLWSEYEWEHVHSCAFHLPEIRSPALLYKHQCPVAQPLMYLRVFQSFWSQRKAVAATLQKEVDKGWYGHWQDTSQHEHGIHGSGRPCPSLPFPRPC